MNIHFMFVIIYWQDLSLQVYEEVSEDNRNSTHADDSGQENQPTHNISNDNADNDQFTDDGKITPTYT